MHIVDITFGAFDETKLAKAKIFDLSKDIKGVADEPLAKLKPAEELSDEVTFELSRHFDRTK